MERMKTFLLVFMGSLLPVYLSAQSVSGKLIDENSQPLPYANVVLLSLPDSAFVSGTISGEDGSFTLEATSQNQLVKISSIGYKTVYRPVSPTNIGIIQLVSDAQQLGEVVVKADLPKTRVKGDAMVTTCNGSHHGIPFYTCLWQICLYYNLTQLLGIRHKLYDTDIGR